MDSEVLKMLAQFRILLKKEKGAAVDFEKIVADTAYARSILSVAEDSDNELLVSLALTLRDRLGLLQSPKPAVAAAPAKAEPADPKTNKYMFGARS